MRTIPTASTFSRVREAYLAAKKDSRDAHDDDIRKALSKSPSGVQVPVEIRASQFGRGLFVRNPVLKDTPIYEATRYGIFWNQQEWTTFLQHLPAEWRYDAVVWSYVVQWDDDSQVAAIDLDEGSLMNHGWSSNSDTNVPVVTTAAAAAQHGEEALSLDSGRANLRYDEDTATFHAVCNIGANEELLCDYTSFHVKDHSLEWYRQSWKEIVGKEEEEDP